VQIKVLQGVPIPRDEFEVYLKANGEAINSGATVSVQRHSGAPAA